MAYGKRPSCLSIALVRVVEMFCCLVLSARLFGGGFQKQGRLSLQMFGSVDGILVWLHKWIWDSPLTNQFPYLFL